MHHSTPSRHATRLQRFNSVWRIPAVVSPNDDMEGEDDVLPVKKLLPHQAHAPLMLLTIFSPAGIVKRRTSNTLKLVIIAIPISLLGRISLEAAILLSKPHLLFWVQ